jgi:hypothetical protein
MCLCMCKIADTTVAFVNIQIEKVAFSNIGYLYNFVRVESMGYEFSICVLLGCSDSFSFTE